MLDTLVSALMDGSVRVIDLTAPLSSRTPRLQLPEEFGQTAPFELDEISRYDDRGPAWYWNNFRTGEHTGTHFDAPVHWVTGRHLDDVSEVPPARLVGPAAVIDCAARVVDDPDFLLEVSDVEAWEAEHGPLPSGGWVLIRSGWSARGDDPAAFANADAHGPHTPGLSVDAVRHLAGSDILGIGVETVGTDAGAASGFDPPFPCHALFLGADKYGLTQLRNLDQLPPTGAVVVAAPLPIVHGSGSPCRVLALVGE